MREKAVLTLSRPSALPILNLYTEPEKNMSVKKYRVLFVCSGPGVRAMVAEAFFNKFAPADFEAVSAQFEARKGYVPDFVHRLMREVDLEIADIFPPTVFDRHQKNEPFDAVVTLCHASTQVVCPIFRSNIKVLYRKDAERFAWSIPDFRSLANLTGEEKHAAAQLIRNQIEQAVKALIVRATADVEAAAQQAIQPQI